MQNAEKFLAIAQDIKNVYKCPPPDGRENFGFMIAEVEQKLIDLVTQHSGWVDPVPHLDNDADETILAIADQCDKIAADLREVGTDGKIVAVILENLAQDMRFETTYMGVPLKRPGADDYIDELRTLLGTTPRV